MTREASNTASELLKFDLRSDDSNALIYSFVSPNGTIGFPRFGVNYPVGPVTWFMTVDDGEPIAYYRGDYATGIWEKLS
jgi:hypothetical protein